MGANRWNGIEDYPNYRIDNTGIVESKARGPWKEMRTSDDRYGYLKVTLSNNGVRATKNVHQLVAKAFVDGYKDGYQVNHKNGNKHDNRADNLEWISTGDNLRHAYENKLNYGPRKKVRVIETGDVYLSEKDCAEAVGGCRSGITGCLKGRRRTHKGLHYEYVTEEE